MQLTVDHDLTNEDELLRLSHTGLDVKKLQSNSLVSDNLVSAYKLVFDRRFTREG